jgi:hypothetical protein
MKYRKNRCQGALLIFALFVWWCNDNTDHGQVAGQATSNNLSDQQQPGIILTMDYYFLFIMVSNSTIL